MRKHQPASLKTRKENPGMKTGKRQRRGTKTKKNWHRMKASGMILKEPLVAE